MFYQKVPRTAAWPCLHPKHLLRAMCLAGLIGLGTGDWAQTQAQTQSARRPAPPPKAVCLVADFRSLALQTHDPRERAAQTRDWLGANGSACTPAQLNTLASNRAAWLGNADSPALMGMIDGMIERLEARQAASAAALAAVTTASAAKVKAASNVPATETVTAGTPPPRTAAAPNAQAPAIAPVVVPVAVPTPAPPPRT